MEWPAKGFDVSCLSISSRADEPEVAFAKAGWAGSLAAGLLVYKKIDSTLRGNLGCELEAIIGALKAKCVIIAPAFPAQGRATIGGEQLYHGCPVSQAAFATDPISPVSESFIPAVLAQQSDLPCEVVSLAVVERGWEAVAGAIAAATAPFLVCDSVTDDHLASVAAGAARSGVSLFLCGSAGLAAAMPGALSLTGSAEPYPTGPAGHAVLFVSGSRHPATQKQLGNLPVAQLQLDATRLILGETGWASGHAARHLSAGDHVALTVAEGEIIPGASEEIAARLAGHVLAAVSKVRPALVVATGGDVAMAVCRALKAEALRLEVEVLPGVPASTLVGGPYDGLWIVTKAGGFGREDALVAVLEWWKSAARQQ